MPKPRKSSPRKVHSKAPEADAHAKQSVSDEQNVTKLKMQDTDERRMLRHKYRKLINDTKREQSESELVSVESDKYATCLDDANKLFKEVTAPREAALDSELLYLCAALGKQKVQALNTDFIQFQPLEYAEKVITLLSDAQSSSGDDGSPISLEGWKELGRNFSPFFNRSSHLHFMLGTFNMESLPKPVKVTQRRTKKDKDESKVISPDNVDEGKVETTTEEVERVLSVLHHLYKKNGNEPLCYFEFIVNPHSFGLTIENIFHVAFLVKDCLAEIFLDADKLPCIAPVMQRGDETQRNEKRNQVVTAITQAEWSEIVKNFKIEQPLIPPKIRKSKR